eukprot:scaffold1912_cov167-Amphora_coffeaeformis.AAC.42
MRIPHPQWTPSGTHISTGVEDDDKTSDKAGTKGATPLATSHDIGLPIDYVTTKTWQFSLLWISVFGNATGGLALLSQSKLMLVDIWAGFAPNIVDASFATAYVSALGVGMAVGRFEWSALSDFMGRQNTYALFGFGIPVVGLAPWFDALGTSCRRNGRFDFVYPSITRHILFRLRAIHGTLFTAWAASAVVGPMGLTYLRSQAAQTATYDLIGKVDDPVAFEQAFGCSPDDMGATKTLFDAKNHHCKTHGGGT